MLFNIIAAVDINGGIGKNNQLPWYNKEDLKHFSKVTKGNGNNAIIMGVNTWNSLPRKPLPGRANIVLSRKFSCLTNINYENTWFCNNLDQLNTIPQFKHLEFDECWYIGGEKLYTSIINESNIGKIIITRINGNYNCDTFFPKIPETFKLKSKQNYQTIYLKHILKLYIKINFSCFCFLNVLFFLKYGLLVISIPQYLIGCLE